MDTIGPVNYGPPVIVSRHTLFRNTRNFRKIQVLEQSGIYVAGTWYQVYLTKIDPHI